MVAGQSLGNCVLMLLLFCEEDEWGLGGLELVAVVETALKVGLSGDGIEVVKMVVGVVVN